MHSRYAVTFFISSFGSQADACTQRLPNQPPLTVRADDDLPKETTEDGESDADAAEDQGEDDCQAGGESDAVEASLDSDGKAKEKETEGA